MALGTIFSKMMLIFVLLNAALSIGDNSKSAKDLWLAALPFTRTLKFTEPLMGGKDVVILQNLLRRYRQITSLKASGFYDDATREAVKKFQKGENLLQQDGVLDGTTGERIVKLLMHDGYKDDGKC